MQTAYFSANQDPKRDQPESFISIEEARRLKAAKTHFFVCHGQAIQALPQSALTAAALRREAVDVDGIPRIDRGNWIVVDQTSIPGTQKYKRGTMIGPGRPRYSFA